MFVGFVNPAKAEAKAEAEAESAVVPPVVSSTRDTNLTTLHKVCIREIRRVGLPRVESIIVIPLSTRDPDGCFRDVCRSANNNPLPTLIALVAFAPPSANGKHQPSLLLYPHQSFPVTPEPSISLSFCHCEAYSTLCLRSPFSFQYRRITAGQFVTSGAY